MKQDVKEYCQNLISTIMGWKLTGPQMAVLLCIYNHICSEEKDSVRVSTKDFLYETHYSRQPIVDSIQYLLLRGIISREVDKSDNKGYLYSIVLYDMEEETKEDGLMEAYNKNGNGYAEWDSSKSRKKKYVVNAEEHRTRYRKINVDEWKLDDYAYFVEDLTKFRAEKSWNLDISNVNFVFASSFRRNQTFVNIIDFFNTQSGENYCPLVLKAYLEWYTDNKFKGTINNIELKDGMKQFSIGLYFNKTIMQSFLDIHGISKKIGSVNSVELQLSSYTKDLSKKNEKHRSIHLVTIDDMDNYYKVGISSLLSECGIVLSGNYLIERKKKSFADSAKEIGSFLHDLNIGHGRQKKALLNIIQKTCLGSPYYKTMKFLNWHVLYSDVFDKLKDDFSTKGFEITSSKKRNSYKFFVEKEKVEI